MKFLKPFAACCLLGLVALAGCGGKDSGQDAEPQPTQSPPVVLQTGSPTGLPRTAPTAQTHPICRNLREGDTGYPGWTFCCDNDSMTQSYWTSADGVRSGTWAGSCASWGVRP
jgi:hypothetical protein